MKVVFYVNHNGRAKLICDAVQTGLARHGQAVTVRNSAEYREPEADIAVFYGLWGPLREIQQAYPAAGRTSVLIDLGYWGRTEGGKLAGYHKVVINGRHATDYFQRIKHPSDRFEHFGIVPEPFGRFGSHVLLCGMSSKAAWVYGLQAEQWERQTVAILRSHSAREIRYRPKPSWKGSQPIDGASWSPAGRDLMIGERSFADCWAVVTHHGNTALDALIAGVPVFCEEGLASVLARRDLAQIESPLYPDEAARDQLLYDAAYTQFKVAEIADGTAWARLKNEGLV